MNIKDLKVKLTIRSIVLYEKLTEQPFSEFTMSEYNLLILMYCMLIANNEGFGYTLAEFSTAIQNDRLAKELVRKTERMFAIRKQFTPLDEQQQTEKKERSERQFVKEIVPVLVEDIGLNINYIMDDMDYEDIGMYIDRHTERHKEDLLEKRLFTYLTMTPHIKAKKYPMEKVLPFPWEEKDKRERRRNEMEKNREKMDTFLKSGPVDISEIITKNNG